VIKKEIENTTGDKASEKREKLLLRKEIECLNKKLLETTEDLIDIKMQ
jgi:hypothetical protein